MKHQPDTATEETDGTLTQPKRSKKSASFFWPILLIVLGTLLLLNNLEILSWNIWNNLWKFWPLILILIGLEMLLGKGKLTNLLITIIGLGLLLIILTINIPEFGQWVTQLIPQLNLPQLNSFFNNQAR
jgi:hypothetical protein